VNVERYVLPKFRVSLEFTANDGKMKRDYRPGDHVTGTVRANYFFGKPVDNAAITLKASAMDAELFTAATAEEARMPTAPITSISLCRDSSRGARPIMVRRQSWWRPV